jgi:hypothetical protein
MTEAEWLACTDTRKMLEFLRGKASDRKLRLFACACLRRIWVRRGEQIAPEQVVVSERYADGGASGNELKAIRSRLGARGGYSAAWAANNAQFAVLEDDALVAARRAVTYAIDFVYYLTLEQELPTQSGRQEPAIVPREGERSELCGLLRDVSGNPFHHRPPLPRTILAWNDSTIPHIAGGIYEERRMPEGTLDNSRLAILADALLDAGCDNEELIRHCRSAEPHVRGCWAVDLINGKG